MRISREKIVRLSHKIMDVLVASDDVEFIEDRDTIRQQIVTLLTATLREAIAKVNALATPPASGVRA